MKPVMELFYTAVGSNHTVEKVKKHSTPVFISNNWAVISRFLLTSDCNVATVVGTIFFAEEIGNIKTYIWNNGCV